MTMQNDDDDNNISSDTSSKTNQSKQQQQNQHESNINSKLSTLERLTDRDNTPYAYHPSWRPPTPPPPSTYSSSNSTTSNSNNNKSHKQRQNKSSSWIHSIINKQHSSDDIIKSPPVNAFHIPNVIKNNHNNDKENMVDTSSPLLSNNNDSNNKIFKSKSSKQTQDNQHDNDNSIIYQETEYEIMNDDENNNNNNNNDNDNNMSYNKKRSRKRRLKNRGKNMEQKLRQKCDFFYTGMEELESQRQPQSLYATMQTPASLTMNHELALENSLKDGGGDKSSEYFNSNQSRRVFMEEFTKLNASNKNHENDDAEDQFDDNPDDLESNDYDDGLDFTALFTFGCSPASREKELNRRGITPDHEGLPAIADIRKSSLSYFSNGRVQIRLPKDRVRLLMDDHMEAGILCVEKEIMSRSDDINDDTNTEVLPSQELLEANTNGQQITTPLLKPKSPQNKTTPSASANTTTDDIPSSIMNELQYVMTIDQDLYKRVLSEIADSRSPCGIYYCCHDYESKSVNINVALGILAFVFSLILWGTLVWPTD